jgi:predicted membrane protein
MKRSTNIIIGLVLIAMGIIIGLRELDIVNINVFFKGWWTLFIIIPSLISLINDDDKYTSLTILTIGILLLLGARDIIDINTAVSLIFPVCIIFLGLYLVFKSSRKNKYKEKFKDTKCNRDHIAVFASDKFVSGKDFESCNCLSLFGGVDLDLREAVIKDDVIIKSVNIFGSSDIRVPKDVNVEVNSASIFGGVDNKVINKDKKPTIYVESVCIFGGMDIK